MQEVDIESGNRFAKSFLVALLGSRYGQYTGKLELDISNGAKIVSISPTAPKVKLIKT